MVGVNFRVSSVEIGILLQNLQLARARSIDNDGEASQQS